MVEGTESEGIEIPVRVDKEQTEREFDRAERAEKKARDKTQRRGAKLAFFGGVLGGVAGAFVGSIIGGMEGSVLGPLLELGVNMMVAMFLPLVQELLPIMADASSFITDTLVPLIHKIPGIGSVLDKAKGVGSDLSRGDFLSSTSRLKWAMEQSGERLAGMSGPLVDEETAEWMASFWKDDPGAPEDPDYNTSGGGLD